MARSIKRKDFDYYITNLDWDDGSDIDRTIKQFTRNDVFEHTYEKPGFYSVKGLVFKFERAMIEATPPMSPNMTTNWKNVDVNGKQIRLLGVTISNLTDKKETYKDITLFEYMDSIQM